MQPVSTEHRRAPPPAAPNRRGPPGPQGVTLLKIHHVVLSIVKWGGPGYTVPALCSALGALGNDVVLHVLEADPGRRHEGFTLLVHRRRGFPRALGISPELKSALRSAAGEADFLHSHSLWSMPTVYPAWAARGTRCRLLLSPRGTLDPWAWRYHHYRKMVLWLAGQRANLLEASCLHATAPMEYGFFRELGLRAPIAIVPNGVDLPGPDSGPPGVSDAVRRAARDDGPKPRRLLFLARVHPKKGVDILIRSWRNVQESFPAWELVIAGHDDGGYLPVMRRLASDLGAARLTFTDWFPEAEKTPLYRSAELYILPTRAENWGVSVADALAHGLPAIVSKGAPWSGLGEHGCGWWIENPVEAVTECLREALALTGSELRERGARGREWMARDFAWSRVGRMMNETYGWLLNGGTRPGFVLLD